MPRLTLYVLWFWNSLKIISKESRFDSFFFNFNVFFCKFFAGSVNQMLLLLLGKTNWWLLLEYNFTWWKFFMKKWYSYIVLITLLKCYEKTLHLRKKMSKPLEKKTLPLYLEHFRLSESYFKKVINLRQNTLKTHHWLLLWT